MQPSNELCPNMAGYPGLGLGWCSDDCFPTQRLTYGQLPDETIFRDRFRFANLQDGDDPDEPFRISSGGSGKSIAFEGAWTVDELWEHVKTVCSRLGPQGEGYSEEEWDDEVGEVQVISSVLHVLRIEWV